jgi:ADP-ribosyl-[dinitrogen reductase] hydrolase
MSPSHAMNRARGAMLGMAVGDALGAPLEGLGSQDIKTHYGLVDDYVDGSKAWRRKNDRWRLPGLYTDDTQQALCVAETLIECGQMQTSHLTETWRKMYRTPVDHSSGRFQNGVHRNIGKSFRTTLEKMSSAKPSEKASQPSAGLGAAVRVIPLAIAFCEDSDRLYRSVVESSLLTHTDVRSIAAALAVAFATARLLNGESREPSLLFRVAGDTARCERRLAAEYADRIVNLEFHSNAISRSIARVDRILEMPQDDSLLAIMEEARNHGPNAPCKRPTMGFAPAALASCFYFLISSDSYQDGIVELINQGGDADTAAAILGGMLGAYFGYQGIPKFWLTPLYNADGLDTRAIALTLPPEKVDRSRIPDLIETEKKLCILESQHRQSLNATISAKGGSVVDSSIQRRTDVVEGPPKPEPNG